MTKNFSVGFPFRLVIYIVRSLMNFVFSSPKKKKKKKEFIRDVVFFHSFFSQFRFLFARRYAISLIESFTISNVFIISNITTSFRLLISGSINKVGGISLFFLSCFGYFHLLELPTNMLLLFFIVDCALSTARIQSLI